MAQRSDFAPTAGAVHGAVAASAHPALPALSSAAAPAPLRAAQADGGGHGSAPDSIDSPSGLGGTLCGVSPATPASDANAWALLRHLAAEGRTITISGRMPSGSGAPPLPPALPVPIPDAVRKRHRPDPPSAASPAPTRVLSGRMLDPLASLRRPNGLTRHGTLAMLAFANALQESLRTDVFFDSAELLMGAMAPQASAAADAGTNDLALSLRDAGRLPIACPAWETLWALYGELDASLRELRPPWLLNLRPDLHAEEQRSPGLLLTITKDTYTHAAHQAIFWLDQATGRNAFTQAGAAQHYVPLSIAIPNLFAQPCHLCVEPAAGPLFLERRPTRLFPPFSNTHAREHSEPTRRAAHRRLPRASPPPLSDSEPEITRVTDEHGTPIAVPNPPAPFDHSTAPIYWSKSPKNFSADGLDAVLCVGDALLRADHRSGQHLATTLADMWNCPTGAARPAGPARTFPEVLQSLDPLCHAPRLLRFMETSYNALCSPPEIPSDAERRRRLSVGDFALRFMATLLGVTVPPQPTPLPLAQTLSALRGALATAVTEGRLHGPSLPAP